MEEAAESVVALSRENRIKLCTYEIRDTFHKKMNAEENRNTGVKELIDWADKIFIPVITGELLQQVEEGYFEEPLVHLILLGMYQEKEITCLPFVKVLKDRIHRIGILETDSKIVCVTGLTAEKKDEIHCGEVLKQRVVTSMDIKSCPEKVILLGKRDLITPLARDEARKKGIEIKQR